VRCCSTSNGLCVDFGRRAGARQGENRMRSLSRAAASRRAGGRALAVVAVAAAAHPALKRRARRSSRPLHTPQLSTILARSTRVVRASTTQSTLTHTRQRGGGANGQPPPPPPHTRTHPMASAAPRRSFVDVLHRGTVYFLAASTVYFSVECVRATYYIQVRRQESGARRQLIRRRRRPLALGRSLSLKIHTSPSHTTPSPKQPQPEKQVRAPPKVEGGAGAAPAARRRRGGPRNSSSSSDGDADRPLREATPPTVPP
jgi:hypothetical protein